jgi:hypothetical protein
MTTVLDPTNEQRPVTRQRTERAAAIDGMTIGLLDISKPRGNVFLDRLQELLEDRGFGVRRYAKPTFTKPAPADLRHQISQECNLVIEALAD